MAFQTDRTPEQLITQGAACVESSFVLVRGYFPVCGAALS